MKTNKEKSDKSFDERLKSIMTVIMAIGMIAFASRGLIGNYNIKKAESYLQDGYSIFIDGREVKPESVVLEHYKHQHFYFDEEDKSVYITLIV